MIQGGARAQWGFRRTRTGERRQLAPRTIFSVATSLAQLRKNERNLWTIFLSASRGLPELEQKM